MTVTTPSTAPLVHLDMLAVDYLRPERSHLIEAVTVSSATALGAKSGGAYQFIQHSAKSC